MQYLLRFAAVLLLDGAGNRINMTENEVQVNIVATLVRSEHNSVWSFVIKLNMGETKEYINKPKL